MPPSDFTSALGKLLSDGDLLARFLSDGEEVADGLGIAGGDRAELLAIDRRGLVRQAFMLVDKRLHEVARLVPRTMARLGRGGTSLFREYARGTWPEGHRRHVADALAFCAFLAARGYRVTPAERAPLRLALGQGRFAISVTRRFPVRGKRRPALLIFWRRDGRVHKRAFHARW